MGQLRQHFKDRLQPPDGSELAPVLTRICADLARHGNFNMLLSDGRALFVHCSTHLHQLRRSHPFPHAFVFMWSTKKLGDPRTRKPVLLQWPSLPRVRGLDSRKR